ncbi:hypothetical protein [Amycolatopsis japonica]
MKSNHDTVTIPVDELRALMETVEDLTHAVLYSQRGDDAWGVLSADKLRREITARGGQFGLKGWYGRNHLHLKPGDKVYREDGEGERDYSTILAVTTFAAYLDDGVSGWLPWRYLHTDARRHDEPAFDVTDWGAIAVHMGYRRDGYLSPDDVTARHLLRALGDEEDQGGAR